MTKRLSWKRQGCAIKTTNADCKFGRGFGMVRSPRGFELVGMGLHFGTFDSMRAAKAEAQRTFNAMMEHNIHPVALGGA